MREGNKYLALLIEDDLEDADLYHEYFLLLTNFKIEVIHVTTLNEGILKLGDKSFDIILTDLNLPDSFGLDTLKKLIETTVQIPIIVMTGLKDNGTGLEAVNLGAQDFLVKGRFNETQLLHSIQYAISRSRIDEHLRTDQNLLFKIFNHTPVVLFLVDRDRNIVKINNAGVSAIRKSEKEIIGLRGGEVLNCIHHLQSPDGCGYAEKCQVCPIRNTIDKSLSTKKSFQNIKATLPIVVNDKIIEKHFLLSAAFIEAKQSEMVLLGLNDITELEQAKEQIDSNNKRLETQLKILEFKPEGKDELLNYSLEQALLLTKSDLGFIALYNEETQVFNIHSWSETAMKECEIKNRSYEFKLQDTGCWTESVRRRKTFFINDFEKENSLLKGIPAGHVKLHNYLSVPYFSGDKIIAVVSVANKKSDYDNSDGQQLSLLMESIWRSMEREGLIAELKVAKEQAEESDRLKSAFLANMSHEIRTPMNSILGFVNILQEQQDLSNESRENFLDIVQQSSVRLLDTINDIIEVSKIESGHLQLNPSNVNISEVLGYIRNVFAPEAEKKGIGFSVVSPESIQNTKIETDKNKVESILVNLIKNAIKFTNTGFVEVGCNLNKNTISFYVKDTGIGIPQDKIDLIFERFGQVDAAYSRSYEGSGLGLSIVNAYAKLLGGMVTVESQFGVGSTFSFHLENKTLSKSPRERISISSSELSKKTLAKVKILIAEDEEVNYLLMEQILSSNERNLLWAKNGLEAVELYEKNRDIEFIFMDIKMPVMDGIEATRKIRSVNKDVPIVALTAYALSGDAERFIAEGCNDYLAKPVKSMDIKNMINKYVR